MANYLVSDEQLTWIANTIRAKTGGSSPLIFPEGFVVELGKLSVWQMKTASGSGTRLNFTVGSKNYILFPINVTLDNRFLSGTPIQVTQLDASEIQNTGCEAFLYSISANVSNKTATVSLMVYNPTDNDITISRGQAYATVKYIILA